MDNPRGRRDRQERRQAPPALEVAWDELERAPDNTYSTTIRINLSGWWEGGRPNRANIAVYQHGEEPREEIVQLQQGRGTHPRVGLQPGRHYRISLRAGEREVQKLLAVPELPKPKRPEEEALEVAKLKVGLTKAQSELREAEKGLKKKPKLPELKLVSSFRSDDLFVVTLARVIEGKGAPGSILCFDAAEVDGKKLRRYEKKTDGNGVAVFQLTVDEAKRTTTFLLPEKPDEKIVVEVPAKEEEPTAKFEKETALLKKQADRVQAEQELKKLTAPKPVTDLRIQKTGMRGSYTLYITPVHKESEKAAEVPVPGVAITITDGLTTPIQGTSGDSGTMVCPLTAFTEPERLITVTAGGIVVKFPLYGP